MSEIISTRRKVAIQAVESYRSWDIETIMAYRADNCIHEIAPSTSYTSLTRACFSLKPDMGKVKIMHVYIYIHLIHKYI